MADTFGAMSSATSGMIAQARRLQLTSENIANVDTPGYRRKTVTFEAAPVRPGEAQTVQLGDVILDQSDLPKVFEPGNPLADTDGYYQGSTVDLVVEIADAREAQRSYEANIRVFDQARAMTASVLEMLRR